MNKILNNRLNLFLYIAIFLLFSCDEFKEIDEINQILANVPKISNKAEYSRDSLFISYTIKEYIKNNYVDYNYQLLPQDQEKVNIYIDNANQGLKN